ncbi:FCD domain-containing protein [Cereibacter changlensis]|uniref:FCD domain-containing protein n=1 Tax=Cereibacter changlensis TaxID=402884 RepID=A0A2W7RL02_9RHOB|nr:FCD domain-containing protein [Cereibacter changlensis]PZX56247.1 FCD domain-containing protein [Cereibacter changlensis]
MIQCEAYRRAVVAETDPDEIIHIFTMRAAVEPIAVGLAMQRVDEAFLERLRDLHARMDHAIAASDSTAAAIAN